MAKNPIRLTYNKHKYKSNVASNENFKNWETLNKKHKQVSLPVQHKQVLVFALSRMTLLGWEVG